MDFLDSSGENRLTIFCYRRQWLRKLASMADGDLLLVKPCGLSECAKCALDVVGT